MLGSLFNTSGVFSSVSQSPAGGSALRMAAGIYFGTGGGVGVGIGSLALIVGVLVCCCMRSRGHSLAGTAAAGTAAALLTDVVVH